MVGSLLSAFTAGMIIRTVVMLVVGGGLLAVYILIKKRRAGVSIAEQMQAGAEQA